MNALNFIDGVFVDAVDGETLANVNPATGQEIGTIARSKKADVEVAAQAAMRARKDWASRSMLERADWLDRMADGLEQRKEEIAQRESRDTGKPLALARRVDAQRSIDNFDSSQILPDNKNRKCSRCLMRPTLFIEIQSVLSD